MAFSLLVKRENVCIGRPFHGPMEGALELNGTAPRESCVGLEYVETGCVCSTALGRQQLSLAGLSLFPMSQQLRRQ
jgi:hypothetical protein